MGEEAQLLADLITLMGTMHNELPRHQQIYLKIRSAILQGILCSPARLPSSRALANSLQLSRTTVNSAYDQLIAEGFLLTRQGAGTYVADLNITALRNKEAPTLSQPNLTSAVSSRLTKLPIIERRNVALGGERLMPGLVDPELFPYTQWNKLFNHQSRDINNLLPHVDWKNGYAPLREALAQHLAVTRGVNARPQQIFITHGAAQSMTLITKVLTDPGDSVWVEDPGYPIVKETLALADLDLEFTPVDQHGINPSAEQIAVGTPRLLCTSASYQFPLGYTMPVSRRLKLLEIAREKQCWIVEDDYDGEFRYKGNPIPSLFGLEDNDRTIYVGTFSKTLSLTLRTGFIVVPPQLVHSFQSIYPMFGNFSSVVTQAILAKFISQGYFARHLEHMRKVYAARRRCLEQMLKKNLTTEKTEALNPGGLHITALLKGDVTDTQIREDIAATDLGCVPLSTLYSTEERKKQGFLLGFTSCNENAMADALAVLQQAILKRGGYLVPM